MFASIMIGFGVSYSAPAPAGNGGDFNAMKVDFKIRPSDLSAKLRRFWERSGEKVWRIEREFDPAKGAPVFTVRGKYTRCV